MAEDGSRIATVVKQREMAKGATFAFSLRTVELGQNRHGEVVTTCIVDPEQSDKAPSGGRARLSGTNKRALEVLSHLTGTSGREGDIGVPSGYASVPEKWWRDRFYEQAEPGAEQGAKQRAFHRAANWLLEHRHIGMAGGRVWCVT